MIPAICPYLLVPELFRDFEFSTKPSQKSLAEKVNIAFTFLVDARATDLRKAVRSLSKDKPKQRLTALARARRDCAEAGRGQDFSNRKVAGAASQDTSKPCLRAAARRQPDRVETVEAWSEKPRKGLRRPGGDKRSGPRGNAQQGRTVRSGSPPAPIRLKSLTL